MKIYEHIIWKTRKKRYSSMQFTTYLTKNLELKTISTAS